MDTEKTTQTLSNARMETFTLQYVGHSPDDIDAITACLQKHIGTWIGAHIDEIDEDVKRLITRKDGTIVDKHFEDGDIICHVLVTRVSVRASRSTPLLTRTELARYLGRTPKSMANTMLRLRRAGIPMPDQRQPIPLDLAREIKMRMERDADDFIKKWKWDLEK